MLPIEHDGTALDDVTGRPGIFTKQKSPKSPLKKLTNQETAGTVSTKYIAKLHDGATRSRRASSDRRRLRGCDQAGQTTLDRVICATCAAIVNRCAFRCKRRAVLPYSTTVRISTALLYPAEIIAEPFQGTYVHTRETKHNLSVWSTFQKVR